MNSTLQNLYQSLETQRATYTNWVLAKPMENLNKAKGPGRWSAAQVVYHLSLVDHLVVHSLEKTLANKKNLPTAKIASKLRAILLSIALKLPIKFKTPKQLGEMPARINLPKVLESWQASREKMQELLQAFPDEFLTKQIFLHPRSGMLSLPQTLAFLLDHHQHHQGQLQKALA